MQIVVEEESVGPHDSVERLFSGVTEGRMAHVVCKRQSFGQVDVQAERTGDGAQICATSMVWVRRLRKWSE